MVTKLSFIFSLSAVTTFYNCTTTTYSLQFIDNTPNMPILWKITLPLRKTWTVKVLSYYKTIVLQCRYIDCFLPQVTTASPHFELK